MHNKLVSQDISLLIVEDDSDLREALAEALAVIGYQVTAVDCVEEMPEESRFREIDAILLDVNLPGESGLSLAKRLRQTKPDLGIIMLSARTSSQERSEGFRSGADIYLSKPASIQEIHQATQSLLRRLKRSQLNDDENVLVLDVTGLTVSYADDIVKLTRGEAKLLAGFSRAAEKTLENWQIAELLEYDLDDLEKSLIELQVSRLRKKLSQVGKTGQVFRAIRGVGYQLCEIVRIES